MLFAKKVPRNPPMVFIIRSSTSKSLYEPGYVKKRPVSCASSIVSDRRNVNKMMFLLFMSRKKGVDRLQTIRDNTYNLICYYDNIVILHSGKA